MKKVFATVVYPVSITLDLQDDLTDDQVREKILEASNDAITCEQIRPVITECTRPNLIE